MEKENSIPDLNGTLYMQLFVCSNVLALFPGPAQLSVASSTEKRERAWNNLSRE